MLNIIKSNNMENLMDAMVALSASARPSVQKDPMMPEWIGVQSKGMRQWISIEAARRLNICANFQFFFPRQIMDEIFLGLETFKDKNQNLNDDLFFWSVLKQVYENRSQKEFLRINNYLSEDDTGRKLFQFSMKMANVFNDYQVYRPHMLLDWKEKKAFSRLKDPDAHWQAKLWQKLVSNDSENHLAFKADTFLKQYQQDVFTQDHLPGQISFFGLSSMPKLFLQILNTVSDTIDIYLYLLTPSNQYFFDIKSEKQISKMAVNTERDRIGDDHYEMTNPLLSSLGLSGKRFHASLEAFDYHEPIEDLFEDPLKTSNTMLSYLQSDILNLVHRKRGNENEPVKIPADDTSLSIHACHSPMRETQVLKDLLLNEFEENQTLEPHDILVMMPDIEAYAPFIESVFSLEKTLPFSISDRRKRSESETLEAFLKILALKDSRLEQRQIVDLLLSPSIARAFHISLDDISSIEKMVADANILWGEDSEHKDSLGLAPFAENTWQFGFRRLFMGMIMPENYGQLVKDILPCESFEGLELDVLGKLAKFCDTLFSCLNRLNGQKTMDKWCDALKQIRAELMDQDYTNTEDMIFLSQTIDQMKTDTENAKLHTPVSYDVIRSYIEQKLDMNISQGSFLNGTITFCNIMPMRSIPFKMIVLMGMDERSFPRQTFSPGFDLIKKYPESGDKVERDEDRYLFLETLLSAKLKVMITYTGLSIKDNSEIPCSGVISELIDTMNQSFVFQKGYVYHFYHGLHPFNSIYFNSTGSFFSFSQDNCTIAKSILLKDKTTHNHAFITAGLKKEGKEDSKLIQLEDMIRFFKNPIQAFLKNELNIKIPQIQEHTIDREVFTVSGLEQHQLGNWMIENNMEKERSQELYTILKASGRLPFGEKGNLEYERIRSSAVPIVEKAAALTSRQALPELNKEIAIGEHTISASLSNIKKEAAYELTFGKVNGARLISCWINHLFLNIAGPDAYPKQTFLIGRDPKNKQNAVTVSFSPIPSDAGKLFERLVELYEAGRQAPVYFFCETGWQFVNALPKKEYSLDREAIVHAMEKSRHTFYGGYYQMGEAENPYISLCIETFDPFKDVETLMASGFPGNAVTIFIPIMEHLTVK